MSAALFRPAVPATLLTRYLMVNGLMYLSSGVLFVLWPYAMELAGTPKLLDAEAGYLRMVGLGVMQIASFYLFGMRTRWDGFALSSLFNRFLAPVEILPLVFLGLLEPMLGIPFTLTDAFLATVGFVIWQRSGPSQGWLSILFGPPAGPATALSRFLLGMGATYAAIGLAFYFLPDWLLQIHHVAGVVPHELGYLRAIGIATLQIGWFYAIGSKTRSESFALWSIIIRGVSAVGLIGLAGMGLLRPELGLPLAGLDAAFVILGLIISRT